MLRRALKTFRQRVSKAPPPPEDFDPIFYRANNPDLAAISDPRQLFSHYETHGRAEGRPKSMHEALEKLQSEHGHLPEDFDISIYRILNKDVNASVSSDLAAAEHYLRYGKGEGRLYSRFESDIYNARYFPDRPLPDSEARAHYQRIGRAEGRLASSFDYLAQKGATPSDWPRFLDTKAFVLLNHRWAGDVSNKLQAIDAMLESGFERMAPIALDLEFDAAYYREIHPEIANLDDVALYRDWVERGLVLGEAGAPQQHLQNLGLNLTGFPAAFDFRSYAQRHGLKREGRWAALEHLVTRPLARHEPNPATGEGSADFLAALETVFSRRNDAAEVEVGRWAQQAGVRGLKLQAVADAHYRQSRWAEALDIYKSLMADTEFDIWTCVNGARAARKLNRTEEAIQLLEAGVGKCGGENAFRDEVRASIEAAFNVAMGQAHQLCLSGDRSQGDEVLRVAVECCRARWALLDPTGAVIPPASEDRVVVLANTDLHQCTHYRVEQKAQLFRAAGRPFEIYAAADFDKFMSALPGASAAIFYRLAATPLNVRAIDTARALGIATYYEIDDLIFDEVYPEPIESYSGVSPETYAGLQVGVPLMRAAMAMCDYGISSTKPLAEQMSRVVASGQVFVLPNGLDQRNQFLGAGRPERVRRGDEILLFYGSGTLAHNTDFLDLAADGLLAVFETRPGVRLMLVGYLSLDYRFEPYQDRIVRVGFVPNAQAYWALLAEADINLAVLHSNLITDGKSEIKWLEAAVMGIPSLVTETAVYRQVLDDGADVLIAADAEAFGQGLLRLVDDATLREAVGAAARRKAVEVYGLEANAANLEALLEPAFTRAAALRAAAAKSTAKRVLLVNVFFPPQTIGGATRVVRDNLDDYLAMAGDSFEFAVLTSDYGEAGAHRLRVDSYRGCPVFRLSTPQEVNMDWRPLNAELAGSLQEVIELWRPDLIHFHCIQRLTATCLAAAQDLGIPQIVTAHDAWWIADHQFLVNQSGDLVDPTIFPAQLYPDGISMGDSVARQRSLRQLLSKANVLLTVSESFAALYRDCGYPQIRAIPNGLPFMSPVVRRPSSNGKVRLAFVGGLSAHKGFDLVRAAFRSSRFPNLELTIVDHAATTGLLRTELWGETKVSVVGKTAQEQMNTLYAEHDVLLAPSIWPESYGLVTREALKAGLRVLASDRGAIGEDVTHGVNGWVIDVANIDALVDVLTEINRNSEAYLEPPPPSLLRTAQDQARDLLDLYGEVLARSKKANVGTRSKRGPKPRAQSLSDPDRRKSRRLTWMCGRSGGNPDYERSPDGQTTDP